MSARHPVSTGNPGPILIRDRTPFYRGFLFGSLVAAAIYAAIFAGLLQQRPNLGLSESLTAMASKQLPFADLAVARAEEINRAAVEYVENCGDELAAWAWHEASSPEERYHLLSSFIAFSPQTLADYMPADFEIVLWEDLREIPTDAKVGLLAAGSVIDY